MIREHAVRAPLLALVLVAACSVPGTRPTVAGSGVSATEIYDIEGIHAVSLAAPGTLHIEQGEPESLTVEADENILPYLEIGLRGSDLDIRVAGARLKPRVPIRMHLVIRDITGIRLGGSGSIEAPGLRSPSLSLSVAGSGTIRLPDLEVDRLEAEVAGSGDIETSGTAQSQRYSIAGSGSVRALELQSETVQANIAGSGSLWVNASREIDANIVGSGSVRYRGDPRISLRRVGSGSVSPVDEG
jgi:hypothetical protein